MTTIRKFKWFYWLAATLVIVVSLSIPLLTDDKSVYLPGTTTHGHHQIEMSCSSCHSSAFGGKEVLQNACVNCHGAELKAVDDSHPKSKFTDPRNAYRLEKLDARYCMTCHVEHRPEQTHAMGVTVADDFCFQCHADVADDRPSHKGMAFTSCATGGCHNFHDNTALYEDFLIKHLHEPDMLPQSHILQRDLRVAFETIAGFDMTPLSAAQADAPKGIHIQAKDMKDWLTTAHAKSGVNCLDCHGVKETGVEKLKWVEQPGMESCKSCHVRESEGFLQGKHGMRIEAGLSPMQVEWAKQPMRADVHERQLNCLSCHAVHEFNTRIASVDACLDCHADKHSLAFKDSPHFRLFEDETAGKLARGNGVSCATCHMPRTLHKGGDVEHVLVEHNQNRNLRPNEKMIRSVCMSCHGLGFSIDALADKKLIENNFSGSAQKHVQSLDLAERRIGDKAKSQTK